ncbi:MAG: hypothetical protein IPJ69_14585 [Deltaproteobacteria bacterium]|nr:MAG: hypothetical protein IPJ69_14585 [Deltaproteobacteria bacterium]
MILENSLHSEKARATFGSDLFKMFEERYFHADPIPANALYDPESEHLTWIDWGVTFLISEQDKDDFLAFNGDFSHHSPEEVARQFLRAVKKDSCTDERRQEFIDDLRVSPIPPLDSNGGGLTRLKHLLKIANRHGIRLRQPIRNTLTWFFRGMNVIQGLRVEES